MSRAKAVFRPMTDLEVRAAQALGAASFAPATNAKRIARTIAGQVTRRDDGTGTPRWAGTITDKQAALMWRLVWSYRRSIHDERVLDRARSKRMLDVAAELEKTIPKGARP